MTRPQGRCSLKTYSCFVCSILPFRAISATPSFRITDCNASLSRLRSTISIRGRLLSLRNSFTTWRPV
jgi:hypothetical protein